MNDKEMTAFQQAIELGRSAFPRESNQGTYFIRRLSDALTEAEQRGYRLGQEDMREQATAEIRKIFYESLLASKPWFQLFGEGIAEAIRALPISPQPQQKGKPDDR